MTPLSIAARHGIAGTGACAGYWWLSLNIGPLYSDFGGIWPLLGAKGLTVAAMAWHAKKVQPKNKETCFDIIFFSVGV
jgi:hypothetical protein